MKTLRIILSGGLGNQLFQYAAGRALAERSGAELVLDTISGFKDDHFYKRTFELNVFEGLKRWPRVKQPSMKAWLWLRLRRYRSARFSARMLGVIDEPLDGSVLPQPDRMREGALFMGFWQDEAYFREIRQHLLEELRMEGAPEPAGAVAIHFRRINYTRGVGADYFEAAIDAMRQRLPGAFFHLFTDDPAWGADFVKTRKDFCLRSHADQSALADFQQMSRFKHFIIANSTFSWWAAWLAESKGSHIIAPSPDTWSNPRTVPDRWCL